MVRKVISIMFACALIFAFGVSAHAVETPYQDGNISSTYVTYFKDIVSGIGFKDNYVAYRSGQYEYKMVVGDLSYDGNLITLSGEGKEYVFISTSGYNASSSYSCNSISDFALMVGDSILYSDVGDFPELISRGEKYEILSSLLIFVALLGLVLKSIFSNC